MHKYITIAILPILLLACSGGADREGAKSTEVMVFVAASLRESMEELGKMYEAKSGVKVNLNLAGSNDLARQIKAAPVADVFLSADAKWMDTVQAAGRVKEGTRVDVLSNSLVIIAAQSSPLTMTNPCDLVTMSYKNLSMGDPDAVPAGKYAKSWMSKLMCDGDTLWNRVKGRVAPGADVRAALGLVLADPNVIGAVYKTDWMAFADRTKILFEVTDGPKIRYVLAELTEAPHGDAAKGFRDFLVSPEAMAIFQKHGFIPLVNDSTSK